MLSRYNKNNLNITILSVILLVLIAVSYVVTVYDAYSYAKIKLNINYLNVIPGLLFIFINLYFISKSKYHINQYILTIFFWLIGIPITVYYIIASTPFIMFFVFMTSFPLITFTSNIKLLDIKPLRQGKIIFNTVIILTLCLYIKGFIFDDYFMYFNLDILKVFDNRELITGEIFIGYHSYFKEWIFNIILLLLTISMIKKNWIMFILCVFLTLVHYGISSSRAFLFWTFLLIVFNYYIMNNKKTSIFRGGQILVFSMIFTVVLEYFYGFNLLSGLVTFRTFLTPAIINNEYFEFFSVNPHTFLSTTKIGFFLENPYSEEIPKIIGYNFWGAETENFCNVGIWGTGYQHFGIFGCYLFCVIIGLIIAFIKDIFNMDINISYKFIPLITIELLVFRSGDLLSSLLTNGIILTAVLIYLYISNNKSSEKSPDNRNYGTRRFLSS